MALLSVENLSVSFRTESGNAPVVEDVSLDIQPGEVVGLVGESGCGKSVTAMSIMRLLPSPPSRTDGGRIVFEGTDLLAISESQIRALRGNRIGMIFQEPMTSLNPVYRVGDQIGETLRLHRHMASGEIRDRCLELLGLVGIGAPERRLRQYPHQLSGGLRQRVMIAMALACHPTLLIADEPTTALDVTIQAQILDLLARLRREIHMAILLITHDLGVVAETCDRVVVMYAGRVVERADTRSLFRSPQHPYTRALLESTPRLTGSRDRMPTIPGMVPSPGHRVSGCNFRDRCRYATAQCAETAPAMAGGPGHRVACWNVPQ
ncbi:MAG: ABC transporter ATP-binding protein [Alphaproteobacteria bacterium]|nr:ABC transporter ATP-binding protein [Alphaproteobacteria bacterium]